MCAAPESLAVGGVRRALLPAGAGRDAEPVTAVVLDMLWRHGVGAAPLRGLLYNIGVPRSPTRGRGRARAEAGLVRMIRAASTDSGVGVLSVCHVRVSGVCLLYVVRPSRTE